MAELWTAFHGARKVLALGALVAPRAVLAEAGAAARPTLIALLAVLADACAAAGPASVALLVVLAKSRAATGPASMALLAMLAKSGTAALPALLAVLAVRALLVDAPPDWVRRRGRFCRNCCSCLHGAKWQRHMLLFWLGAF